MPIEQIIVLAVIQGITEFLPISSSGHLILIPALTGWPDQGLITDVMVHMGSLVAILIYFWRDVYRLAVGGLLLLRGKMTDDGKLALYLLAGSVPAVIFGLVLKETGLVDSFRSVKLIAWNAIIFGVLLLIADMVGKQFRKTEEMTLGAALFVGCAQALALIPGTSRSGITMTAARFLNFSRPEAARFSFLLGIPATAGAGILTLGEALEKGVAISGDAFLAAGLTLISALAAIAFLMTLLRRISFFPFVLYRLVLGGFLLVLAYS